MPSGGMAGFERLYKDGKLAIVHGLANAKLVAEPSGAVTFAAFLFHANELPNVRHTVAVISGGNVEPELLAEVLSGKPASTQTTARHP